MAERKWVSVHRSFTPEERRRFEAAKTWAKENKAELTRLGLEKLAEMDAAYNAMQMLKRERERRGISLGQLSERTGMDKSNLSKLENDRNANPTLETLVRIARALGGELVIGWQEAA